MEAALYYTFSTIAQSLAAAVALDWPDQRETAGLVERLQTIVAANAALAPFHQQQKESFSA